MSKFEEAIEVLRRIESTEGTKEGKMLVKGTMLMDGEDTIHSSFDNTSTVSISRCLIPFTDVCSNCIRTVDPTDKVEFIKINFTSRENQIEVMLAADDDVQFVVLQEHPIRDLRKRPLKEQKVFSGYQHVQRNFFYPSFDDDETTSEE